MYPFKKSLFFNRHFILWYKVINIVRESVLNRINRSQYKKFKNFLFKCFINTCVFLTNLYFLDGEQDLQFFRLASCGQDCQIKIWVVSFTHILGMYSTSSSLKLLVIQTKFLF